MTNQISGAYTQPGNFFRNNHRTVYVSDKVSVKCNNKNSNDINVYYCNARSLRNKMDELVSLVSLYDFDIISIMEAWFSEKYNGDLPAEWEIKGYNSIIYQRENRRGGGVILYIKDSFVMCNLHGIKEDPHVESVWLDLLALDNIWLWVALFYRSPCPPSDENYEYIKNLNNNYIKEISKGLEEIGNKVVLIMGDFNYPDIDWNSLHATQEVSTKFLDCVLDNFLEQVVHENTHLDNCLDLVLVNYNDLVTNMQKMAPLGNSDHDAIRFNISINLKKSVKITPKFNFKKGNLDKFRTLPSNIDWNLSFQYKVVQKCGKSGLFLA